MLSRNGKLQHLGEEAGAGWDGFLIVHFAQPALLCRTRATEQNDSTTALQRLFQPDTLLLRTRAAGASVEIRESRCLPLGAQLFELSLCFSSQWQALCLLIFANPLDTGSYAGQFWLREPYQLGRT